MHNFLQVFLEHGALDTLFPAAESSDVVASYLRKLGYNVTYDLIPGLAHEVIPKEVQKAYSWAGIS